LSYPFWVSAKNMNAEAELRNQNERLELLLNLTASITSSLDLREVLRAIAANIREVIRADGVTVVLPDAASEKFRVFAMDFPHGKGVAKEELLVTPTAAIKKALETLKPVVVDMRERNELTSEASAIVAAEGIKAFCNIPLANHGQALGILAILRTTETPFSPGDVDFSAARQARSPSPLKTRWHTDKFANSRTSSPRRSCTSKKKSAAR
jgi:formate hydrogenlyase transcriptional activator